MNILAMDTSNQACSVAVISDLEIIGELTINQRRNHSIQLMPCIDFILKKVDMTLDDIDAIAVAEGPGSYTGLRIAATTAKTLAWAKDLELRPVSSLKALASEATVIAPDLIVPIFDARRGNVYTGLYQYSAEGELKQVEADTHIALDKWLSYLHANYTDSIQIVSSMDFSSEVRELIEKFEMKEVSASHRLPRAGHLGLLAEKVDSVPIHSFSPKYLKLAEAEANWYAEHPDSNQEVWVERV